MTIPTHVQGQLKAFHESGDAANYYKTSAQYGHDYGNSVYETATESGFWNRYTKSYLENRATECVVPMSTLGDTSSRARAQFMQSERSCANQLWRLIA